MGSLLTSRDVATYSRYVAVLEVSIDEAAERVVVFDRKTLRIVAASSIPSSKTVKFVVPFTYSTNSSLVVAILDDDGQYNIKAVDGVSAAILATPVDMSQ